MGLLDRLRGRVERRGEDAAGRLDALAQLDPKWSTESLRRRARDVFFVVQRSWIERDPEVGAPFMTEDLLARQRLRIDGLINQRRVHMFENPLIEDLDFVGFREGDDLGDEPRVTTLLDMSLVETILDADTQRVVAGRPNFKITREEYWTFVHRDGRWLLEDVEQPGEGARHMKAPLVGGEFAELSPEMVLRERYARGEIELEQFEVEMAKLLGSGPTY